MRSEPINVQRILQKFQLKPHKGLGQNFLVDEEVLEKIAAIGISSQDETVLEVGPGLGSLTRHLAERAKNVIAVELDQNLIPVLHSVLSVYDNVDIIQGDILDFSPEEHINQDSYSVTANIPYYITSAVIRHLLESSVRPARMTLTVQQEIAERICAVDGKMSLLSLGVQVYGFASIPLQIPAEAFYPQPKVNSAVVSIELFKVPLISATETEHFFAVAKAGFGQKRKTLRNALSSNLHLSSDESASRLVSLGIDPMRRAETLSIEEWKKVSDVF